MTKLWKRSLSMFLALTMVFSMLPAGVLATELETEPVVTEPAVTEAAVTEPIVTEPIVTEPVVTEPVVTEPEATETENEGTLVQETMEVSFEEAYEQVPETTETEETEPELPQLIQGEFSMVPDVTPNKTDDQLFAAYVDDVFFGSDACTLGTSGRDTLSGNALEAYETLRPVLESIASGARGSSVITIGYEITGYIGEELMTFTPEFSANITGETFNEADMKAAVNALLTDMPYELYWYAKTVAMSIGYIGDAGKWFVQLKFPVSASYSASGTNDKFDPDQTKTGAAAATVAKAEQIAKSEEVSALSDYEKLAYFKNYICEQVSYNGNSGSFSDNSDPWQIIYVFDGNPETNVVCEGYAKAFKHLCDLADFENNSILCEIVTGYTTGPHMWNIVRIDGVSYLVDVTNLDDDNILNDRAFFLTGASGSIADGYTVSDGNDGTLLYDYSYVSDTGETIQTSIDTFGDGENSILNISDTRYYSQQVFEADLAAHMDQNFTMTDSVVVTGDMTVDLSSSDGLFDITIPEGITLTVTNNATLTLDAFAIIKGGELIVEPGAKVVVKTLLCVGYGSYGGTLTVADGGTVTRQGNSTIQLMQNGKSYIDGTVDGVVSSVTVDTAEDLAAAIGADYPGVADLRIDVKADMTLLENLPVNTAESAPEITINVNSGYTLSIGTAETNVALTNNHNIVVYPAASLVVADGSTLDNQGSIYSGGTVSGTITGTPVITDDGGSGNAEITETDFAEAMQSAAENGSHLYYRLTNSLELTTEHVIPANVLVEVVAGCTLTVAENGKLTVEGSLQSENGSIVINGSLINQNDVIMLFSGRQASLLVSETGVFTNNGDFGAYSGTVTIDGTFNGGMKLSLLTDFSGDVTPDRIELQTYADNEADLITALEKKDGYASQHAYVVNDIRLENSLVVPKNVGLILGAYRYSEKENPQYALVVPDGVTLTVEGYVSVYEVAMLQVESGGRLINRGTVDSTGYYINTGFFVGEPVNNYDSDMNESYLRQAMSAAVENGKPVFLRDPLVLTEDLEIISGAKFLMDVGGRIEVPEGRTLTVSADTEILGGQLVVHPGGNLILNNSVSCHRGTLYVPDGANVDQYHNLDGIVTDGSNLDTYLSGYWVHDFGEGYFLNDEQHWETRDMEIVPGSGRDHIFYLNVFNNDTLSWDQTPLHPNWLNTSEFISLEQMEQWEEFEVKEGEPNSQCFVHISVADDENAWDQAGYVSYNYEGTELIYEIYHKRSDDMGFYSAPEATNANWLEDYKVNPLEEDNSFYFIFHGPEDIQSVDSVEVSSEDDRAEIVKLDVDGHVYKITIKPEAAEQIWVTHGFDVEVTVKATRTDDSYYEESRNIYVDPLWLHELEADAEFELNGEYYRYFAEKDKLAVYTENGAAFAELPDTVNVEIQQQEDGTDRLTVILENAHLNNLQFSYYIFDENGVRDFSRNSMPSDTVNLVLIGENELVCDYNHALIFCDGANANICGNGSLLVKTIATNGQLNDEGYALAWDAMKLWNDSNLTISGDVTVTAEVEGVGHHENGEQTFLSAVRLDGGNLTLCDNASLSTVLPAGARRSGDTLITEEGNSYYGGGYAGVEAVNTLTILDSATLNTQELYVGNYCQSGGEVNITSIGNVYFDDYYKWDDEAKQDVFVDQRDGYHYDGLCAGTGTIEISGGELTIDVLPTEEEHNVRSGFSGLSSEGGVITISDDAVVNINGAYDGTAIVAANAWNEDGSQSDDGSELYILGGELNITGTIPEFWPRAIDVYPVSNAEFNGGTINAVLSRFAIGGMAIWKRTILNGSDIIFHVDNEFRMSSGEMNLQDMSIVEVNGFGEFSGNSYLNLENSGMVVNGECHLIHDAVVEMNQGDEDLHDFSLLVNGNLSVEENAQILINQELTEEREMIPIVVNGNFEQKGGYVSAQQNEFCKGAAMLTWGKTIISGGTMDIYGNEVGIAQGYYFDRPEDNPSQFCVEGGTVSVSSGYIGILANGPVNLYGGNVNVYAEGIIDTAKSIWPHAVMVEKYTGNEEGTGDNVASLNVYGGMHSFQAVDASENEACSKALSLLNAPLNFYGGRLNLDAEMTLYSISESLEEDNVNGDPTFRSGTTEENITITSREFTESEEVDNDFFHTLLEEDESYVTVAQAYATMTVDEFLAQMDEAAQGGHTFTLTHSVVLDQNVTLTAGVEVIGGATLTVASGSVLTIPAGTELAARDGGAILVENGGQISNYGLLVSQYGYITADSTATVAPYVDHEGEENVGALDVYAVNDETAHVDGIDKTFITARVEFPTEEYFDYWLNEAPASYGNVRIIRNESLYMPERDLIIQHNVTFSFGGSEEYVPVLNVGRLSIDGEFITAYATVNVATELSIDGTLTLNQTDMTVSGEWAGTDYDAVIMINDGSVLIVDVPEFYSRCNIHVGFWKADTTDGPAGTINVTENGVFTNTGWMNICEEGVVNVNGVFNNFYCRLPNMIGREGDVPSYVELAGQLNVNNELNNDTFIQGYGEDPGNGIVVEEDAQLWNSDTGYIFTNGVSLNAKENSTVRNEGLIDVNFSSAKILGTYEEGENAQLIAGYEMAEDGTKTVNMVQGVPVGQQILQLKIIRDYPDAPEEVEMVNLDHVKGLIDATAYHGFKKGYVLTNNVTIRIDENFTVPESISFYVGTSSEEESISDLVVGEDVTLQLYGSVVLRNNAWFDNFGHVHASGAEILFDGDTGMVRNHTSMMLTDETQLRPFENPYSGVDGDTFDGGLYNEGSIFITGNSYVEVHSLVNDSGDDGEASIHVGFSGDPEITTHEGYLKISSELINAAYIAVNPTGQMELSNVYADNVNDENGVGYFDVHGKLYINGGSFENQSMVTAGADDGEALIEVSENCSFYNAKTGFVGSSANGSIVFNDPTSLNNSGYIENDGGAFAINGTYEATEDGVALVCFDVNENGSDLDVIEGLSNDQVTIGHYIDSEYTYHNEDSIHEAVDILKNEDYAHLQVNANNVNLDITYELHIPENMTLNIVDFDENNEYAVTVAEDAFLYNDGTVNVYKGGKLVVNGLIGQGGDLLSEGNGQIVVNESGQLMTLFDGATTRSGENASVVNEGMMSGPAEIQGAYTHGANAYIGGGYVVHEDGTVEVKEAVGPNLPNSIKSLNHSITAEYPAHGEDTARAYLEYVQANGYADGSLNILPDSALDVAEDLSVPFNVAIQVHGTLNLSSGVKLVTDGSFVNNGTINLETDAAITANADISNTGIVQGACGDDLTWKLENGALTFTGSGDMINYTNVADIPWNFLADTITEIRFTGNAPAISENAFTGVTATAYYPAGDSSWAEVVDKNYGGNITWVADGTAPEKINLSGTAMTLGNSLSMDFAVDISKLSDNGAGHYAVITKHYADGSEAVVTRVEREDWAVYSGNIYTASCTKIAAKEMCDEVEIVFYNADGYAVTNTYTDSVKAYAMRTLTKEANQSKTELLTTIVDMLNYGAAAQQVFGYDTGNLANAELTEAHQAMATTNINPADTRVKGPGYAGSTLTLESQILLDFVFYDSTIGTDFTGMYAIATYTDHYGKTKEVRLDEFKLYSSGLHYVSVSGMAVADCSQLVSCTVYNSNGEAVASASDSVEGYIARQIASGRTDAIYTAILKFAASAYNYFH